MDNPCPISDVPLGIKEQPGTGSGAARDPTRLERAFQDLLARAENTALNSEAVLEINLNVLIPEAPLDRRRFKASKLQDHKLQHKHKYELGFISKLLKTVQSR